MKDRFVLGIDIGGSEVKFGIVSFGKDNIKLVKNWFVKSLPGKENLKKMLDLIVENIHIAKKEYPEISYSGIGVAGMVDFKIGKVIVAPNLIWNDVDIKNKLEEKTNLQIVVDNDANMACVGIYYAELLKKYPNVKNVICFTLGTGVGGGIIVDGKILHGENTSAAELGHITVEPQSNKKCGCGNYGCLESFVGARWFIKNIIDDIKKTKPKTLIYELVNDNLSLLTPRILYEAAMEKDIYALEQWRLFGKYLGIAIGNLINIFNPEIIVFTGGVAKAYRFFLPSIKKEIKKRVWPAVEFKKKYSLSENIKFYFCLSYKDYGILGAAIEAYNTFLL